MTTLGFVAAHSSAMTEVAERTLAEFETVVARERGRLFGIAFTILARFDSVVLVLPVLIYNPDGVALKTAARIARLTGRKSQSSPTPEPAAMSRAER
ncbi:MAG: hypothetical protein ACHQ06_07395, partial [Candidatus Dormibacteria bacterium]